MAKLTKKELEIQSLKRANERYKRKLAIIASFEKAKAQLISEGYRLRSRKD